MAKSMKPGGGGRFAKMASAIERKEGVSKERADAIASAAGRKKYGAGRMASMAAADRKRASQRGG